MQSPGTLAWVMIAHDFFARITILDPALWKMLSNTLHLDCVSSKLGSVLSDEQCDHHEVSLHLGRYRMDSEV